MAERAVELLALPHDGQSRLILDLGCGSGLAGHVLEEQGHAWIGMDISPNMLEIAASGRKDLFSSMMSEEEEEGDGPPATILDDIFLHDMGQGVGFRPGTFDGCISISALQWLCHSNKSVENPKSRLSRLFSSLFASLARGARAVFQFYPENPNQIDLILGCATKAGFNGGLVVDYPHSTKAKKYYLCLMTGSSAPIPKGLTGEEASDAEDDQVKVNGRRRADWRDTLKARKMKDKVKGKDWVLQKRFRWQQIIAGYPKDKD